MERARKDEIEHRIENLNELIRLLQRGGPLAEGMQEAERVRAVLIAQEELVHLKTELGW